MSRESIVLLLACFVFAGVTLGDTLIFEDGRELEGQARRDGDKWIIVTEDGETLVFPREEIKRHLYVSRVSPVEAAEMFREFRALVEPALNAPVPLQHMWLRDITDHSTSFRYEEGKGRVVYNARRQLQSGQFTVEQGGRVSSQGIQGGGSSNTHVESKTLRDKGIDAVFVDEWALYVANYDRLAEDLRYKGLIKRAKYSGSLYDFAMWPPDELEEQADAMKQALDSVAACVEYAETTNRLLSALPIRQVKLHDRIMRAQNAVERAKSLVDDADPDERDKRKERLRDKERQLRDRIADMNHDIPLLTRNAERKISDFTRQREVTRGAIARAASYCSDITLEYAASANAPDENEYLDFAETMAEANKLVLSHRERVKGLTTLGVEKLRAETDAALRALFENRSFSMRLYIHETTRDDEGGYELVAADHENNLSAAMAEAHLGFAPAVFEQLAMCRKGEPVALVAHVRRMRLVNAWPQLEENASDPRIVIYGTIRSLETDCG